MPVSAQILFYLVMPWSGPTDDTGTPIESDFWVDGATDIRLATFSTQDTTTGFIPVGGWEVGYRGDVRISVTHLSELTTFMVQAYSAAGLMFDYSGIMTGSTVITFQPTDDITSIVVGPRGKSVTNISIGPLRFWKNFKGQAEY